MSYNTVKAAAAAAALLVCAALTPASISAQGEEVTAPTAVYVEFGGSGLVYSLNYEARLSARTAARVGFMFLNITTTDERGNEGQVAVTLMPVMGNVLMGRGSSRLELGLGPIVGIAGTGVDRVERLHTYVEVGDLSLAGLTSSVGYRYQPAAGGFMFRATATPFYSGRAQIWGGLSFGWAM